MMITARYLRTILLFLCTLIGGVSAQRINLNFTAGSDYSGSAETSPATPEGSAGSWNNISLTEANTDVAVVYSDGSAGPTLQMDTGRSGNWTSSITSDSADYTGAGAVYDVANLYEAGIRNGDNSTLSYRLRGLEPGTYTVHMVPIFRGYQEAGAAQNAGVRLVVGTGNDTDERDSGDYTLVTTDAAPDQYIDTSLTSWEAATDGSTPYNVVSATVTIDSTNRWLTFLFEDGAEPDRPGPAVIQIEGTGASFGPVITGISVEEGRVILQGTNGSPNVGYHVMAGTNLVSYPTNWPSIGTNWFDAFGGFSTTNAIDAAPAQQYFRLLVDPSIPERPQIPVISGSSSNLNISAGMDIILTVDAGGTEPLTYSWLLNGTTPLDCSSNTLTLVNVQADDIGDYYVVISNSVGVVTGLVASLTVDPSAPFITAQPQNRSGVVSNSVQFSVAAGGTQPLSYQWYFEGSTPVGDNTNVLTLVNIQTNDAGAYSVVVGNSVGSITSSEATLTILGLPEGGGLVYVAPAGLASNPGTLSEPTTLEHALSLVEAGGTIYMRGGTYSYDAQITIDHGNDGAAELPKQLFAFPGEQPVLDFSSEPYGKTSQVSNPRGLQINADYWYLRGLEVMGSADNGIFVAGNSNVVEQCVTHDNRDTGLQISRYSSDCPDDEWPSYNLILNCDSYDNYDCYPNEGENADGFACKLTSGPGNVFDGCISHHNIDDGWDMYTKTATGPIGVVTLDRCIAYANGSLTDGTTNDSGDRNGFKLGGSDISVDHIVTRCIAFGNGKNGFTFNSNPGAIRMVNNFAFDNEEGNFKFDDPAPVFINNLSFWTSGSGSNDRYGGNSGAATGDNNVFWYDGDPINDLGLSASADSFETLSIPSGGFARYADGSICLAGFATLVEGDELIDAGDFPGLSELPFEAASYYLNYPDIGAVETGADADAGPIAPTIVMPPESVSVDEGGDATFSVMANGTAPLAYQWYFDTDTLLAGATNSSLTVTGVQASDAGAYSVVVSNPSGSITSAYATLTVIPPSAPSIVLQPVSQTNYVGRTVNFSVEADGTAPLVYQWYFNSDTALSGGTNTTLTLSNIQTNDAGGYSVVVANTIGSVTSAVAVLSVDTNTFVEPDFEMVGYATENGGTTGGEGGATVTVDNFADFEFYVDNDDAPYIVQVQGTINLGSSNVRIRDNKTIVGLGTNAWLVGNLKAYGNDNIIVRNLHFTNPAGVGDKDGLTLHECLNVWVDHCTFNDCADGCLDIAHGADWITVSWCKFYYTDTGNDHRFVNLVGHSDSNASEDTGKLHVTFHHDWWSDLCHERMPRIRFGRIHSFNNYFNAPGNNYCIRAAMESEILVENSWFQNAHNPWEVYITDGTAGKVCAVDNVLDGCNFSVGDDSKTLLVDGDDSVFVPPYVYAMSAAADVPEQVTTHCGAAKGPFAP